MHVQHCAGDHAGQRKKFPAAKLIIADRLLVLFANRVGIQARQCSIRPQDLAIQEVDLLERRSVRHIEISEAFTFESQYLDELVLLSGNRRTAAQGKAEAAS